MDQPTPLQQRRAKAGLTVRDIALYAGMNRGTVSLLERGRYIPTPDELGRYMSVIADYEFFEPESRGFLTDEEKRIRAQARGIVTKAIRKGDLVREPCERCGKVPGHAHHRNGYTDPLDVVWLCAMHHGMEHTAMNEARRIEAADNSRAFAQRLAADQKHRKAVE